MTDQFTDLPTVKTYLKIPQQDTSEDDVLALALTIASDAVKTYLQTGVLEADYVETYDGNGSTRLVLRQRPIKSVASLIVGSMTIPPTTRIETASGVYFDEISLILRGYNFAQGQSNVAVSYKAGYKPSEVPKQIVMATLMTAAAFRSSGGIDPNVQSESVPGAYTAIYSQLVGDIPPGAKALINPLRRMAIT